MKFEQLLALVGDEPVFETSLLLAGDVDRADVQRQLSRWTRAGRVVQVRKGLYALSSPFRKVIAHPFVLANRLVLPSYVSLESALSHHGLIPEHVPVTISVTTGRPSRFTTALGAHAFHNVKQDLFWGYELLDLVDGQQAFVATPEKALLDVVHLRSGADAGEYLDELRLQNLDRLDLATLWRMVERAQSPKLARAAKVIADKVSGEAEEYELL
jgi:predicted transcriptional regulator of viral defense system